MKILFISRWYHTNHQPIVKSFIDAGHSVKFVSLEHKTEQDFSTLEPNVIGYSAFKEKIENLKRRFGKNNTSYLPNTKRLLAEIISFDPDIVVIRNYNAYSMLSYLICEFSGYDVIFHDQIPVCRASASNKKQIFGKISQSIFDSSFIRISPVKGDCENYESIDNEFYLPFVYDKRYLCEFNEKEFFKNNSINIIMIGKLSQKRKNHLHLLKAINNLVGEYDITVSLVGGLPNNKTDNRIREYVRRNDIKDVVNIYTNINYPEVQDLLFRHDLFVLPSEREPASVSLLEAMAQGLPVISSDDNGTQYYISENKNGYIFETGDIDDLEKKIRRVINDRDRLKKMGKASHQIARQNHNPDDYKKKFVEIVNTKFK